MEAYYVDEHMYYRGQYKLNINLNIYDVMCAAGPIDTSFNILAARLMGLDYHIFLQYIRQEFGAELHGKNGRYISYSFPSKTQANKLSKELNKRWINMVSNKGS